MDDSAGPNVSWNPYSVVELQSGELEVRWRRRPSDIEWRIFKAQRPDLRVTRRPTDASRRNYLVQRRVVSESEAAAARLPRPSLTKQAACSSQQQSFENRFTFTRSIDGAVVEWDFVPTPHDWDAFSRLHPGFVVNSLSPSSLKYRLKPKETPLGVTPHPISADGASRRRPSGAGGISDGRTAETHRPPNSFVVSTTPSGELGLLEWASEPSSADWRRFSHMRPSLVTTGPASSSKLAFRVRSLLNGERSAAVAIPRYATGIRTDSSDQTTAQSGRDSVARQVTSDDPKSDDAEQIDYDSPFFRLDSGANRWIRSTEGKVSFVELPRGLGCPDDD